MTGHRERGVARIGFFDPPLGGSAIRQSTSLRRNVKATAAAPIDKIPLFVRAGSIVPMGAQVPSTATRQPLESIRVYPGRSTSFTLYDDDGVSNAYRKGGGATVLRWDDASGRLTASGKLPGGQDAAALVSVVGR